MLGLQQKPPQIVPLSFLNLKLLTVKVVTVHGILSVQRCKGTVSLLFLTHRCIVAAIVPHLLKSQWFPVGEGLTLVFSCNLSSRSSYKNIPWDTVSGEKVIPIDVTATYLACGTTISFVSPDVFSVLVLIAF